MRTAVAGSAAPYGYTLTIWTSGAILSHANGLPTAREALLFMVGAVCGFAAVGALAYGGVRHRLEHEPGAFTLWRALHFLPVGAGIGAAALNAAFLSGYPSWAVAGFSATTIYLVSVGIQLAFERPRMMARRPAPPPEGGAGGPHPP